MTDRLKEIEIRQSVGYYGMNYAPTAADVAYLLAELDKANDDLAAAMQTIRERREAVLAIHEDDDGTGLCADCFASWPCPTARAVGVTGGA